MKAGRCSGAALLGLLVVAAWLAAGCSTAARVRSDRPATVNRLPLGRVLVIARVPVEANRAVAEAVEDLFVRSLRGGGDVRAPRDVLGEATVAGLGVAAPRVLERVRRGGSPLAVDEAGVFERLAIWTVLVVDMGTYEQVWGKDGKVTRVGLEAEAFHLPSRQALWRVRGSVEVEEQRGRSLQYALEEAVVAVADGIRPRPSTSTSDAWRLWRK